MWKPDVWICGSLAEPELHISALVLKQACIKATIHVCTHAADCLITQIAQKQYFAYWEANVYKHLSKPSRAWVAYLPVATCLISRHRGKDAHLLTCALKNESWHTSVEAWQSLSCTSSHWFWHTQSLKSRLHFLACKVFHTTIIRILLRNNLSHTWEQT